RRDEHERRDNGGENRETTRHESSFREGFDFAAGGRSSDSGLPPPPPSRPAGQWRFGAGASPLTAAGPSRNRTGFPYRSPIGREPIMAKCRVDSRFGRRSSSGPA